MIDYADPGFNLIISHPEWFRWIYKLVWAMRTASDPFFGVGLIYFIASSLSGMPIFMILLYIGFNILVFIGIPIAGILWTIIEVLKWTWKKFWEIFTWFWAGVWSVTVWSFEAFMAVLKWLIDILIAIFDWVFGSDEELPVTPEMAAEDE